MVDPDRGRVRAGDRLRARRSRRLSATFGQSVRVPWFRMEDVDGDGQQDLVSQMGERVSFHLARPEIDALPSWQLDLAEYKTRSAPVTSTSTTS